MTAPTPPHHTNLACTSYYATSRPANDVNGPLESGESLIPAARRDCHTTFLTRRSLHYDFRLSHSPLSLSHPRITAGHLGQYTRYPLDTKDVLTWRSAIHGQRELPCGEWKPQGTEICFWKRSGEPCKGNKKGTEEAREGYGAGLRCHEA